jgi:hypothetical protein
MWIVQLPTDHIVKGLRENIEINISGQQEMQPGSLLWRPAQTVVSNIGQFYSFRKISQVLSIWIMDQSGQQGGGMGTADREEERMNVAEEMQRIAAAKADEEDRLKKKVTGETDKQKTEMKTDRILNSAGIADAAIACQSTQQIRFTPGWEKKWINKVASITWIIIPGPRIGAYQLE